MRKFCFLNVFFGIVFGFFLNIFIMFKYFSTNDHIEHKHESCTKCICQKKCESLVEDICATKCICD